MRLSARLINACRLRFARPLGSKCLPRPEPTAPALAISPSKASQLWFSAGSSRQAGSNRRYSAENLHPFPPSVVILLQLMPYSEHDDRGGTHNLIKQDITAGSEGNNQFATQTIAPCCLAVDKRCLGQVCLGRHLDGRDRAFRKIQVLDRFSAVNQVLKEPEEIRSRLRSERNRKAHRVFVDGIPSCWRLISRRSRISAMTWSAGCDTPVRKYACQAASPRA
ncbi:hypothetical protein M2165_000421 [Variovorax sp. TBS-050B]|nr:hypothetical protein [Variovorax sp. TBS-050B]